MQSLHIFCPQGLLLASGLSHKHMLFWMSEFFLACTLDTNTGIQMEPPPQVNDVPTASEYPAARMFRTQCGNGAATCSFAPQSSQQADRSI